MHHARPWREGSDSFSAAGGLHCRRLGGAAPRPPRSDPTYDTEKGNVITTSIACLVEADRQVRAVRDEVHAAWADNDADAFVASSAKTATAVLPGTYPPDRHAIRVTMAALFAGELAGSKGVHQGPSVRLVGADVAIVLSRGAMLLAGQTEPDAANRAVATWVLARQDGAWRVQAFPNCPEHAA